MARPSLAEASLALPEFLASFGLSVKGEVCVIESGQDNLNLLVDTGKFRIVVRRYEITRAADIQFEIETLIYLVSHGYPVPRLFRNMSGSAVGEFLGKAAAVFEFVEGISPSPHDTGILRKIGTWLAEYHTLITGYRPASLKKYGELSELQHLKKSVATMRRWGYDEFLKDVSEFELKYLPSLRDALPRLPHGVIHSDFRPDNLLSHEGRLVAVLDFDTSYLGSFLRDLSETILIWSMPDKQLRPIQGSVQEVLAGYREKRELSSEELSLLPASVLLACISDAIRFIRRRLATRQPLKDAKECLMYRRYLLLVRTSCRKLVKE
jgi:homoserine kinase type II